MRLDDARLCLDCEEIHDEQECPACGSEASAFLKRWIKTTRSEPRARTPAAATPMGQPPETDQLDAWRRIIEGRPAPRRRGTLVMRGLVGIAAMGLAGWAWSKSGNSHTKPAPGPTGPDDEPEGV